VYFRAATAKGVVRTRAKRLRGLVVSVHSVLPFALSLSVSLYYY